MPRQLRRAAVVVGVTAGLVLASGVGVASAAGGPVLTWSPTTSAGSYSYAPLVPGRTASQTFTLTNTGTSATSALAVTLAGPAFTKTADGCTGTSLGPNKSCQVTVRYAPTGYGQSDTATLTASNNKPGATVTLTLHGTSVKATPSLATTPSAGGTVGATTLTDAATLTGGSNPTGTITFTLYAGADCTGPVLISAQPVTGTGTYVSDGYVDAAAGSYQWTATYSGDTNNTPVTSACGDEPVGLLSAPPLLSPPDGSVFSNFPRTATYTWEAVPGAASYIYQRLICQRGFTNCVTYPGPDITVTDTSVTTDFVGANPGEWRVVPVTATGIQGPPSVWWTFTWTR